MMATMINLSIILLCALSLVSGQYCQSIISSTTESTIDCQPLNDCTGLSCLNVLRNRSVEFTVDNCQDPVLVNVTISSNDVLILARVFNQSTTLSVNESYQFQWTMDRNASHLFVNSSVIINGTAHTLVPHTTISLNVSDCMCKSIQSIATLGESPVDSNCHNNTECTGLECLFDAGLAGQYNVETEIQPCSTPPGFIFILRNAQTNQILYEHFFNSSANASILFGVPLHVTVEHRNYSMIISVILIISNQGFPLVPRTQIILDKSKCQLPSPTTTTPTSITPTTITSTRVLPTFSPTPVNSNTCDSLNQIAQQSLMRQCTTNRACDTLQCTTVGYRSSFQILPCNKPPGFHVTLYNPDGREIYNGIVTNSTVIPLSEAAGLYLVIIIKHNETDSIGIEVKLRTAFGENDIIPESRIPFNHCQCPNVICSTTSTRPTTSTTPTKGQSVAITAIEISVPVIIFVILFVILAVAVIITVLVLHRKKRNPNTQFAFQQMGEEDNFDKE